jgi:hypothetical protein
MNDIETALMLSTALTQFIENANDPELRSEFEQRQIDLAQSLLDQCDSTLAHIGE